MNQKINRNRAAIDRRRAEGWTSISGFISPETRRMMDELILHGYAEGTLMAIHKSISEAHKRMMD